MENDNPSPHDLNDLTSSLGAVTLDPPASNPVTESNAGGGVAPNPQQSEIPSRIEHESLLALKESSTPGRSAQAIGLFVLGPVKAGELIFKIKEPLLAIAKTGEKSLSNSCDNCFATMCQNGEGYNLHTVQIPQEEAHSFLSCDQCMIVYYCNETCKLEAWEHHHKYECKTLSRALEGHDEEELNEGKLYDIPIVFMVAFRYLLRLFHLGYERKISDKEWPEFWSLSTTPLSHRRQDEQLIRCPFLAKAAKKYCEISHTPDEQSVISLIYALEHNHIDIQVPFVKGSRCGHDTSLASLVKFGLFVDPFVARINHSCLSNSWCLFNGKELQVRATRDIPDGEEITFCYDMFNHAAGDYSNRTAYLDECWDLHCTCALCSKGDNEPVGDLRAEVQGIIDLESSKLGDNIGRIERAIGEMKSYGFDNSSCLMLLLHDAAMQGYIKNGKSEKALKTALILYFVLEPSMGLPLSIDRRLDTLFSIIAHSEGSPDYLPMEELPTSPLDIEAITRMLGLPFREIAVKGIEKYFGADSLIAIAERESFDCHLTAVMILEELRGSDWEWISPLEDEGRKHVLQDGMNELLKWAGIPYHTYEQVFL